MSQGMSPTWQGLSGKTTYVLRIAKFYQAKLRKSLKTFRQSYRLLRSRIYSHTLNVNGGSNVRPQRNEGKLKNYFYCFESLL